jgi:hypothetical protein
MMHHKESSGQRQYGLSENQKQVLYKATGREYNSPFVDEEGELLVSEPRLLIYSKPHIIKGC